MKSRKRSRLAGVSVLMLFLAGVLLWMLRSTEEKRTPNILLITLDTTRMDHLSCYGYPEKTTPNIDALAREGVKYSFAITPSSWTLPAHASLFTGMLPSHHNAHYGSDASLNINELTSISFYTLYPAFPTLAEELKKAGYVTSAIVASPLLDSDFGLSRGFDHYDDRFMKLKTEDRDADKLTALADDWLSKYCSSSSTGPFFLFLNYYDAHNPYCAPAPWGKPDQDGELIDVQSGHYEEVFRGTRGVTEEERRLLLAQYDDEIRFMDAQIGLLFDRMEQLGVYDESLIIVTSDHGESFGEHNYLDHGHNLYEDLIRVPLIIKHPANWRKSGVITHPVSIASLMPTILKYLSLPVPKTIEYSDLDDSEGFMVAEIFQDLYYVQKHGKRYARDQKAIYEGNYKFIWDSRGQHELYDVVEDPAEEKNLFGSKADIGQQLLSKLTPLVNESKQLTSLSTPQLDQELRRRLQALGYIQ